MRLKNTFVHGKMNKDIDERLLPKGQYPHAENVRVTNTDSSDMGAIENVMGNEKLTLFNLTNAKTIGAFSDDSNQKIYWFTTSDEKDLVVEYDVPNAQTNVLLESSNPDGILNFNKNYLITGIVKVINGEPNRDLLIWTDDFNAPRMINIERAKIYGVDDFIKDDISLIKKPPRFAPRVNLTFTTSTLGNNLEDKFLSFATRYKYLDGEHSATSSFTNYKFAPEQFDLDYQTMENNGMINSFNAVNILFDTGDERVTDVELLYKESGSNQLSIIEKFNKKKENWRNNTVQTFQFSNNKKYIPLPEDELFRAYDNVPRIAKALDIIGSRIVFGNYVEGYDLVDLFGKDVYIKYDVSVINKELSGEAVPTSLQDGTITNDTWNIDLTGISLINNSRLNFELNLSEQNNDGSFNNIFGFILNKDYVDAQELATDPDFIFFIESIMTTIFNKKYSNTPPTDSKVNGNTNFVIVNSTSTIISIQAPIIEYGIYDYTDPTNPILLSTKFHNWYFNTDSTVFFKEIAVDTSLKTNRSYEVGMIYMDEYGRASTVLTDDKNIEYIDQKYSTSQNKLLVNINHTAPYWADRYKLVVKQNKGDYHTIYTNIFYEDGLFRWIKLEGANKDKVEEGDTLIVKSDLSGVLYNIVKVRVLEVSDKQKDFIENNVNDQGTDIIEESGKYMKIKPSGFDMGGTDNAYYFYSESNHINGLSNGRASIRINNLLSEFSIASNSIEKIPIAVGSTINILLHNYDHREYKYKVTKRANDNYDNFQDFWETEVISEIDTDEFLVNFTTDSTGALDLYIRGNLNSRFGIGDRTDLKVEIQVRLSEGTIIFETEPEDIDSNIFYETEQTFEIEDGKHKGNITDQTFFLPATIELDFFNCYVQGNGAESYRYKDAFNTRKLNIDLRPSSTSIEKYKEVRRYAGLTYSEVYNENNNLNGINEFNLAKANYKEDIDKKYGYIQKLYSRDTDILVFQEDKVSKVLYGKDLLMNADGTSNISSVESVLGQQVTFRGEYGISRNPESFAFDGYNIYFTDSKRGGVMRLGNNGLEEISRYGLRQFFKDEFKDSIDNEKLGAFDPYQDQYVLCPSLNRVSVPVNITCQEKVVRADFSGEFVVNIDYGLFIGNAGFDYNITIGNSVNIEVYWNNSVVSSSAVTGSGTITFNKDESVPTSATVKLTSVDCTDFEISGNCIEAQSLTVINVILNDDRDKNLTMKSRYKWQNGSYISPFVNHNSLFGIGEVDKYDIVSGTEGAGEIPATGSNIYLESYIGSSETASFLEDNKLGYFISNTLYAEADYQTLVDNAIFPTMSQNILPSGDMSNNIRFTFDRPSGEQYLYLIWDYRDEELVIDQDTKIRIYFDKSGSMNSSLAPLQTMRDTILKDRLLPLYNGDSALYDSSVTIIEQSNERTMDMLNMNGDTPDGNVVVLVFQDEANTTYHSSTITPRTATYDGDISTLRNRLNTFPTDYYRGVIFQVIGDNTFPTLIQAIQNGTGDYIGVNGLSDRIEFNYKYGLTDGGTPQYYLDQIVTALTELGYVL